jgi:ABC-type transporter Mla subunit MlaD
MKTIGYIMITLGFLAGALLSVLDKSDVQWGYFTAALAAGAAGICLVQAARRHQAKAEGKLAANIHNVKTALARIVENISQLNKEKLSLDPYDVRHRIDQLFREDLETFVEARESIAQVHGLHAYADIMSYFAAGERYLNRVWSASADGYIDEVNAYLDKAQSQFADTLQNLNSLKKQPN